MEATETPPAAKNPPKKKPELTAEEQQIQEYTKVVESKFPTKFGFTRKICFLWANKFRVNFYDESAGNKITKSFFVSVLGERKIKKEWEEQFGNRWAHKEEVV